MSYLIIVTSLMVILGVLFFMVGESYMLYRLLKEKEVEVKDKPVEHIVIPDIEEDENISSMDDVIKNLNEIMTGQEFEDER